MTEKAEFTAVKGNEEAALSPQEDREARRGRRRCVAVTVVVVILLISVAFIAGYLVRRAIKPGCKEQEKDRGKHTNGDKEAEKQHKEAIKAISKERIEESLK